MAFFISVPYLLECLMVVAAIWRFLCLYKASDVGLRYCIHSSCVIVESCLLSCSVLLAGSNMPPIIAADIPVILLEPYSLSIHCNLIGNCKDCSRQFKGVFEVISLRAENVALLYLPVTIYRAHNVTAYSSCGIAVSVVVYRGDDCLLYAADMSDCAIEGYGPGLLGNQPSPSL